ncbi:cysteine desulfuration protein SufE [Rhodobacteraceae bacterium RKSG542]|uniref:SufE family protein n=1 Tax=Pseudovibrio flavus TaxID=2529854 RepID=UPI0012BCF3F8|nr:SufE family protein [Pseudovibrio flavus]MTI18946.1 cysteine desulfuration protein SufE [Pseudovibrio flavus]
MASSIEDILEGFEFLDDWEDRYRYVIELGRELEPLSDEERSDANKVQGCVSQVWLALSVGTNSDGKPVLTYKGDSDAHIVRGLVAIVLAKYSGKDAQTILDEDIEETFNQIGLREHLTPQRSNGLASMVQRIKSDAVKAISGEAA